MTQATLRKLDGPTLNPFVYAWRVLLARRYLPLLARKFIREFTQQTVLGWWWLVFRAILPTIAIILILGQFEELQSPGVPYGIHVVGGMILWSMIPIGLRRGIRCFSHNRRLLMHHQFPRLLVVLASMAVPMVYFLIFAVFAAGVIVFYWITEGVLYLQWELRLLLVPLWFLLTYFLTTGVCTIFGIVFLMARDLRFLTPTIGQVWFLLTPIVYPLTLLPENWATVMLILNPMAGIIEGLRWSLFGVETPLVPFAFVSAGFATATFLLGVWCVMRSEILLEDIY